MPSLEEEVAGLSQEDFDTLVKSGSFTPSEIEELNSVRGTSQQATSEKPDLFNTIMTHGGLSAGMGIVGGLAGGIPGSIAAGGFGSLIENVMRASQGEQPMTGSVMGDTAAEIGLDTLLSSIPQAGATTKALRSQGVRQAVGTALGLNPVAESLAPGALQMFNKPIVEDLRAVRELAAKTGEDIPLVPASKVLGGEGGSFLSSLTFTNKGELAQREIDKALENIYSKMHGLRDIKPEEAANIIESFNRALERASILPELASEPLKMTRSELEAIDLFGQIGENLTRRNNLLRDSRAAFLRTNPSVSFGNETISTLKKAIAQLDQFSTALSPQSKSVLDKLNKLQNILTKDKYRAITEDSFIDLTGEVFPALTKLEKTGEKAGVKTGKNTIFDLIDDLDNLSVSAGGSLTNTRAQQLNDIISQVKKSVEGDVVNSLDDRGLSLYNHYLNNKEIVNSTPSKLMDAINTANHVAFMETSLSNPQVANLLVERLGEQKTRRFAAQYLLDKFTKGDTVNFRGLVNAINDPAQRAGIRTMLGGSRALDELKQFASVAENVSLPSAKRNLLAYNAANGVLNLGVPNVGTVKKAAGSLVFALGLDKVLFNPKIGRAITERVLGDSMKTGLFDKAATRNFQKIYSALQGVQASLQVLDENGEVTSERPVVINGVGADGTPRYEFIGDEASRSF